MSDARADNLTRAIRARVSLQHPGLLPARVVRDGEGRLRIQLQRLDAPTLAELLAAGEITRKDGVRVVYTVASAVEALRRAGLVARDLRPGRILIGERGAVLADTGVPLELMPRTIRAGDPEAGFRSPEERAGKPIGARSNVYSLGVLLRAVLDRPVSSGLPKQVEAVIARATAADPQRRYAGPKEFIVAAAKALGLRIRQRPGGGTELVRVGPEVGQVPKAPPAASAPPPPKPEPTPEPARARKPTFSRPSIPKPSIPRPRVPRPSIRLPAIKRPHVRLPAMPQVPIRAVGVVAALAVCVIGGLLLARLVSEDDGPTQLSSAALSMELPDGWDSTKVDREPSIALSASVAAAPLGESGTGLVAGTVDDAAALDKRLSEEATQRTEIMLGRLEAWRYSGLEPERGLAAVAYLAPTSDGSVLVICHARRQVAPARLGECEEIAATIALRGARPAALASVGEGQRAVREVMQKLRDQRRAGRRDLAGARYAPEQARAARELEASYRDAADSLESSAEIEGEADSLAASLRAAAGAYGELAAAAKERDRARYREASRQIAEREAAVERGAAEPLSA